MGLGDWLFRWLAFLVGELRLGPALQDRHARGRLPIFCAGTHCVVVADDRDFGRPKVELGLAPVGVTTITSRREIMRGLPAGILPAAAATSDLRLPQEFIRSSSKRLACRGDNVLDPDRTDNLPQPHN